MHLSIFCYSFCCYNFLFVRLTKSDLILSYTSLWRHIHTHHHLFKTSQKDLHRATDAKRQQRKERSTTKTTLQTTTTMTTTHKWPHCNRTCGSRILRSHQKTHKWPYPPTGGQPYSFQVIADDDDRRVVLCNGWEVTALTWRRKQKNLRINFMERKINICPQAQDESSIFLKCSQEMLKCKIKVIKTAKPLFGHCWDIYCHIGEDKSNTYLIFKKKLKEDFHFVAPWNERVAAHTGLHQGDLH